MSTNNMAKRTAAGTLALAVCIGGGSLALAGVANAAPRTSTHRHG